MTFLPVAGRELLSAARHTFTYYLRVVGAGTALGASLLFALEQGFGPNLGAQLFGYLHATLFGAIWVFVPLLTADCLSRERREGTLGLLFLTRLHASDVVLAKGLAHGLRALTLWLAIVPVVTIPVLMGGVSRTEAGVSVLTCFSALCLGLSAGLLASAWSTAWLRSALAALGLAFLGLLSMAALEGIIFWLQLGPMLSPFAPDPGLVQATGLGLRVLLAPVGQWRLYIPPGMSNLLISTAGKLAGFSALVLAAVVMLAGQKTQRAWQEQPPSALRQWWQRAFCTPVVGLTLYHWWLQRILRRNPIGWLELRTWSGRLVTWGWLAMVISLYSAVLTDRNFFRGYSGIQQAMAWLMVGSVGLSAAGSFRRERESGVLELLLVSPLVETELIWGRLRGLWAQFLPAFGLLLGVWAYFLSLPYLGRHSPEAEIQAILFFAGTYLALPVIGLYFSLRCRHFMTGLLSTLGLGVLLPLVAPSLLALLAWLWEGNNSPLSTAIRPSVWAALGEVVLARFCWQRLRRRLKYRAFPMERTQS